VKIIVVDDEYFVRMGIKSIVHQKGNGHMIVGEAETGKAAVELILCTEADIVFLDITMPGMDGIEVLKNVRENGYGGYIVMLTCHDDFRFVQQALRFGANDYMLKNELVGDEMLKYLDKMSEVIECNNKDEDLKEIQKQEELHFYKENFLKNILQIGGFSRDEFIRGCTRYNVKIQMDNIYIITIHMKHWEQIVQRYRDSDMQVFFAAIDNMTTEVFRKCPEWEGFYSKPYCYHILFTNSTENSALKREEKLRDIVTNICYHLEQILDIEVVISVYRNEYPLEEIHKGYNEANLLTEQSFFRPKQKVFWSGILKVYKKADLNKLETKLVNCTGDELIQVLDTFLKEHRDEIVNKIDFLEILERTVFHEGQKKDVFIYNSINVVYEELERIHKKRENEREIEQYSYLIRQAIQIINERFTEKISLEEVAEELGISTGYFSRLFSSEVNETFSNYVIRKRIDYAKELIMTTNNKFYEIGEMCGFSSSVHFNNMFKKICGITPNQYRKEH